MKKFRNVRFTPLMFNEVFDIFHIPYAKPKEWEFFTITLLPVQQSGTGNHWRKSRIGLWQWWDARFVSNLTVRVFFFLEWKRSSSSWFWSYNLFLLKIVPLTLLAQHALILWVIVVRICLPRFPLLATSLSSFSFNSNNSFFFRMVRWILQLLQFLYCTLFLSNYHLLFLSILHMHQ